MLHGRAILWAVTNLNVRDFPYELHLRLARKAEISGYDIRDLVIEAVGNSLESGAEVTCPMCGSIGPKVMAGDNCRCTHCGAGFIDPGGA